MQYRDYYKILGLERDATQDEIKRTYRKLVRKFHPDISKELGAEDKFKEVGEAYAVLGDIEKRAAYDQLGRDWQAGQQFSPPPNWDQGFEYSGAAANGDAGASSDFFESLFGRMGQHGDMFRGNADIRARGEDHHAKIEIDVRDSFTGVTRSISLRAPHIDASGRVTMRNRALQVKIPKGVIEGQNLRLKGQGTAGMGTSEAGDLYLEIRFKPEDVYRASGADLYIDLPVTPWEAALGAEIEIPTPQGPIRMKIPPGSAQGSRLRIKGRGIPSPSPGDLFAVLQVVLPPADSEAARNLYAEMARLLPLDPRVSLRAKMGEARA